MNIKNFKPIIYFIPLAVLQLTVIPLIAIDSIGPNIIFILIAYYTLMFGQSYGTILGFALGFIFDLISGGLIGASMISFTLSAFIAGYFYNENKIDFNTRSFFFLLIVFICGSINSFLFAAISNSNSSVNTFYIILFEGFLPGLYTSLFGLPLVIISPKKGLS
jgi:rod shape-determining protein MreD